MNVQNVKRSRISGERLNRVLRTFISHLDSIYARAVMFHLTHDDIADQVREEITSTSEWVRVPEWLRSYVHGYWEAKREELYRYHIVWALSCDGKLMTSKEVDELTKEEQVAGSSWNDYISPWGRINSELSRYVWKDKSGKPLYDKSFDRRFR